jgi:carbon-monoxide dehydrogenase large subunit
VLFADRTIRVVGTDRGKSFGEIAFATYNPPDLYPLEALEPGLEETAFYDPTNFTFPGGCHIAEVEIDRESGEIELAAYHAVDDIGTVLNPLIVEGQIHGGVVQGVGQALFETCVYDRNSGQILTGFDMDYRALRHSPHRHAGHAFPALASDRLGIGQNNEIGSAIRAPTAT